MSTAALAGHHPRLRWKSLQPRLPDYDDPGFEAARRAWLAWWEFGQAMGYGAPGEPTGVIPAPVPLTAFEPPVTPVLAVDSREPAAVRLQLPGETASPHYQRKFAATSTWHEVWPGLQCRSDGPPTSSTVYVSFRLTPDGAGNDPGPIEMGKYT